MSNDYINAMEWYVIQTYSGCEDSVQRDIRSKVTSLGLEDNFEDIKSPEETYVERKKNGNEVQKQRKICPGYVFIKCIMDKEFWFIIRNTQNVTGLLGSSGKGTLPVPVPQHEIDSMLMKAGEIDKSDLTFKAGDLVRIKAGAYQGQTLKVIGYNIEKHQVIVEIDMLGRKTETEIDVFNVSRV